MLMHDGFVQGLTWMSKVLFGIWLYVWSRIDLWYGLQYFLGFTHHPRLDLQLFVVIILLMLINGTFWIVMITWYGYDLIANPGPWGSTRLNPFPTPRWCVDNVSKGS